jgi:hypothetical protein
MAETWFDDRTLRRWLDQVDEEIRARLFSVLPAQRFGQLGEHIAERWDTWTGNLAYHAAPVLALAQPTLAVKSFSAAVGRSGNDFRTFSGIIRSLSMLPDEDGHRLLTKIADRLTESKQSVALSRDLLLDELIAVSLSLDCDLALGVIGDRLAHPEDARALQRILRQVSTGLFGHTVYLQLAAETTRLGSQGATHPFIPRGQLGF